MMLEWPPRCADCREPIADWASAGLYDGRWVHKTCWNDRYSQAQQRGVEITALRSPLERGKQLELPMMVFVLMFHFGLGAAVAGWVLLTQNHTGLSEGSGLLLLIGVVTPLIGVTGMAANFLLRRRIEVIRSELETQGGWKPGR